MKKIRTLFALSLFWEIMIGAEAWFTWPFDSGLLGRVLQILILGVAFLYKTKANIKLATNSTVVFAFCFFFLGVLLTRPQGVAFIAGLVCRLFPLWVLISEKDISYYVKYIQKGLVLILIPGLLLHIVLIVFQDIPGLIYNRFYIYGFAIRSVSAYEGYLRFYSVFMEPSYLGTLMAFLLYADKYNFEKFSNKVFLVSLLASLSLAGLVLAALGFVICRFSDKKRIVKVVVSFLFLLGFTYGVAINYNEGNNAVNEMVFQRLQLDDERLIVGNNRFTDATDDYYNRLLSDGGLLMGLGPSEVKRINGGSVTASSFDDSIAGAGYKIYFITYGLLSALFFLFFYYQLSKLGSNKLYCNGFLFIIIATFIQAAYPQSFSWIIPFILGMKNDREQYWRLKLIMQKS